MPAISQMHTQFTQSKHHPHVQAIDLVMVTAKPPTTIKVTRATHEKKARCFIHPNTQ
jgi:hypothetical protein